MSTITGRRSRRIGPINSSNPVEDRKGAGLRILVVEDYVDCAESMAMLLRHYGHECEVACSGAEGVEAAWSRPPDVVLLDIGLAGGMDGWEMAKILKERTVGKMPLLIAISGFGRQADRCHSAEVGIDLHLTKPVDPQFLRWLLTQYQRIIAPTAAANARGD